MEEQKVDLRKNGVLPIKSNYRVPDNWHAYVFNDIIFSYPERSPNTDQTPSLISEFMGDYESCW
ncbi:MAG: hypothetical protein DGJ47_000080 [Rickettsiaceae bacterium]